MLNPPFYDPTKSYEDNYAAGPFGPFTDGQKVTRAGPPKQSFLGHDVYLPFGIPAGPLINANFVAAAFTKGYDLAVYKTVRSRSQACHPWPNVLGVEIDDNLTLEMASQPLLAEPKYSEPISITNSFGVPSKEPAIWQEDMKQALAAAGPGQVLIGSFQGTKAESGGAEAFVADYGLTAKLVAETGVQIFETNLSCPNEGTANLVCFDIDTSEKIVEAIRREIGDKPLILKLAYFADQTHLRNFVSRLGPLVQGLSTINTIAAPVVTKTGEQALPGEGRLRSGVCGAAIRWAGLEMVERLKELRTELGQTFSIIGVGGVTEPADYDAYRAAGADAVMSATGAMWHADLAQQIWLQNLKGV